jgi:hypothetical protein
MAGAFPISGPIDPQAFPFLLVDLHQNGATGSLKVEGPSYQKALYFRGGRILFGSSNDPRDQLGAILIETGTLTPEQLEEANSKVGPGSPLAKVLAETGFVSQRELGEAARVKVERILSDVIAYTAGNFEFEDGVLPKGAVDLKLSTERVLLAAVRRVSDRAFVLRHLGGLDVVLATVPDVKGKFPEVEADAAEVLGRVDGRSTLKDAASGTRLDEFEAAKLACTLLFLGLVRRADARMADPVPVPFIAHPEGASEIDLLATAQEALAVPGHVEPIPTFDPPVPTFTPPPAPPAAAQPPPRMTTPARPVPPPAPPPPPPPTPAPADEPEMAIFVPDDIRPSAPAPPAPSSAPREQDPAPIFVADPSPALAAPPPFELGTASVTPPAAERPIVPPPRPPVTPAPATAPYIPSRTPDLSIPAAPAGVGPSKREAREWKPPARSGATPPPRPADSLALDAELPKPAASRPSKDDLAALDALLNAKGLEGPLQPVEKSSGERWSPQFSGNRAGARPMPQAPSRMRAALIAVVLAAGATAALWYYLGRPQPGASASSPGTGAALPGDMARASLPPNMIPPTASTTLPSSAPVANTDDSPTPTAARSTPPPVAVPSRAATPAPRVAVPAPSAAPPSPRSTPATGAGGVKEARALLASGQLGGAARAFAAHLKTAPAGTSSVQLLVACSGETVQKAVANVSSPELFIVPVRFQGRDCFRLCWGLYPSSSQAASAARALPEYFRKGGATPRVMSAAELQP